MGNFIATYITEPGINPLSESESSFDPLFGFPNGRKERVMVATKEEMMSARLDHHLRDYCAHIAIDYYACAARNWPWAVKCKHEKHVWQDCAFQDWVLRMKEFEREKRMRQRAKRVPIENAGWKQQEIAVE